MAREKNNKPFGIQTKEGHFFDPVTSVISEVDVEDVAHALSNLCRYAGHCRKFYSVAEHSVLVSRIIAEHWPDDHEAIRAGLLHDATEAYVIDLPTPIKILNPDYNRLEEKVMWQIAEALSVNWNPRTIKRVKEADHQALATEVPLLFDSLERWDSIRGVTPLTSLVAPQFPLDPASAKKLFMREFIKLEKKRINERD